MARFNFYIIKIRSAYELIFLRSYNPPYCKEKPYFNVSNVTNVVEQIRIKMSFRRIKHVFTIVLIVHGIFKIIDVRDNYEICDCMFALENSIGVKNLHAYNALHSENRD